jgi:predicted dehydrogenase
MNVAIIGCGLIGEKRAKAFAKHGVCVKAVADISAERANQLAARYPSCISFLDWRELIRTPDIQIICVATPHDKLAEITFAAVEMGKHVLVEKPAARSVKEIRAVREAVQQKGNLVRVGFNHRYHRAFRQAQQIIAQDKLGPLLFVRARYGHGGRLGYDKEWRADPNISGGGELIDQGVHLIDLARLFLGDFVDIQGSVHTYFWDMPVEDNGFLLLKTAANQTAWLHASCTEWKNTFSFEIYGRHGKLDIQGLGGSYGVERLTHYAMLPEMGPPETTAWEYPMMDDSWEHEVAAFLTDIQQNRMPSAHLGDAESALAVVEKLYKDAGYDYHT